MDEGGGRTTTKTYSTAELPDILPMSAYEPNGFSRRSKSTPLPLEQDHHAADAAPAAAVPCSNVVAGALGPRATGYRSTRYCRPVPELFLRLASSQETERDASRPHAAARGGEDDDAIGHTRMAQMKPGQARRVTEFTRSKSRPNSSVDVWKMAVSICIESSIRIVTIAMHVSDDDDIAT